MVKIFNSIFPKVCKNGFRTFVPGPLDISATEHDNNNRKGTCQSTWTPLHSLQI